jgi:hypothetical protein
MKIYVIFHDRVITSNHENAPHPNPPLEGGGLKSEWSREPVAVFQKSLLVTLISKVHNSELPT